MPDYHRAWHPGGTYFFTVNLLERQNNDLLVRHIDVLRTNVRKVKEFIHPIGRVVATWSWITRSDFGAMCCVYWHPTGCAPVSGELVA